MRLKNVTLNNFRCFEHLELTLHPRLTVIVGENGAGKTAVLDAIATGLSPVLTYLSSANQRLKGRGISDTDFRLQPASDVRGRGRWQPAEYAQVILETYEGMVWDEWRPSSAGKEPSKKHGEKQLREWLLRLNDSYRTDKPDLTPVFAYYGARRGYIEIPERLRQARENYDHPATALIGALDSMSDFREMLAWFDQEESSELRANKGVIDENYLESWDLLAVRSTVAALLGQAYSNPHFNKDHRFVLQHRDSGVFLQVKQLSQGYQSMLALGMDFSRRLAIANRHLAYSVDDKTAAEQIVESYRQLSEWDSSIPEGFLDHIFPEALAMAAPAVMLVDEIDLHLHPTWQQRVLSDLMQTFPLTQFIVTTHSPQVLSTVRRENIRILRETEAGGHEAVMPDFSPLAHEAGDALARIMGTHQHPPMPLQDTIHTFEQYVRAGKENSPEAQQLRSDLDKAGYQIHDSDLVTWRFLASRKLGQRS